MDSNNNLTRSKSLNSLEILDNVSNGLKVFHERLTRIKASGVSQDSDWAESSSEGRERFDYEEQYPNPRESTLESVAILERKIEKLSGEC